MKFSSSIGNMTPGRGFKTSYDETNSSITSVYVIGKLKLWNTIELLTSNPRKVKTFTLMHNYTHAYVPRKLAAVGD